MKKYNFIILSILISFQMFAQKESPDVRTGNKFYNSEKYIEAEVEYRKGLQKNPASFEANYNLGNSLFRQNKYKEALEQYKMAAALQTPTFSQGCSATGSRRGLLKNLSTFRVEGVLISIFCLKSDHCEVARAQ